VPHTAAYRIVRADQITEGSSGGKELLLKLFDYLRHHKALSVTGHHAVLFVLDKDVDDIEHRRRRSPHVLYTPSYDAECLLFRYGRLLEAVSAAISAQRSQLNFLDPSERWCDNAAGRWLEWVALCLSARRLGRQYPNYRSVSKVNVPLVGQTDQASLQREIATLAARSGKQPEEVEKLYRRRLEGVKRLHRAGEIDRVFKGKWYADILTAEIRAMFRCRQIQDGTFQIAVKAALMTTLDYDADWGSWFRERLKAIGGAA